MIQSIRLVNWKTHKDTRLDFSKGTNVLVGAMGAGKSSVMDAISYALFGTFPAIKQRRNSIGNIITSVPKQEKEASVRLDFSIGQDAYEVERKVGLSGQAKATLKKNGEYLQSQSERVTEEVEKALKIDYDLFSRAVYSEQNRLDYFLELKAKDRKEQIARLLGLDKFATAEDNTGSFINKIKDIIAGEESALESFDMAKARENLSEANKELERLANEGKSLEEKIAKASASMASVESGLAKLKSEYNKKVQMAKQRGELASKLAFAEKEAAKIDEKKLGGLEEAEATHKSLAAELESMRKKSVGLASSERSLAGAHAGFIAAITQLKAQAKEKEALEKEVKSQSIERTESEILAKEEQKRAFEKRIAAASARIDEAESSLAELQKHMGKCPVCERELTEEMRNKLVEGKNAVVKEAKTESAALKKELLESESLLKKLREQSSRLKVVEGRLKSYPDLAKQLGENEHGAAECSAKLEKAKAEKDAMQERIERLNKDIAVQAFAIDTLKRRKEYAGEIDSTKKKLAELDSEISKVIVDEAQLDALQKELTGANAEVAKLKAQKEANAKYKHDKESEAKRIGEGIKSMEDAEKRVKDKRSTLTELAKFRKALSEAQAYMRSRLIEAINTTMNDTWRELYPYGDYKGVRLNASASDYSLQVKTVRETGEEWQDVDAIASGGERSTACLAMRVSFALVLVPNLRWLILDEPTHNIDQKGLNKFISVFNDTLPNIIEQIFIITHDEALKQAANSKVYAFNRNKEENGSTVVGVV